MINPTDATYKTLESAFEFFNKELFEGKLPTCLITMQRHRKARGYFCPEMFIYRGDNPHSIHEIAMNPQYFSGRSDEQIISTLVHEMVHLWQQEYGNPPRGNYHNREWAEKMESLGLIPSTTGEEGGAKTGTSVTHYINPDGAYQRLIKTFLADHEAIQYQDRVTPEQRAKAKKKNKVKYTCPKCLQNAWGKPGIRLICGEENALMISKEKETDENGIEYSITGLEN